MLVTSKINNVWSVNIIDRGVRVMMVMALSPEACSAHAVITMTLLRLRGAVTVVFTFK